MRMHARTACTAHGQAATPGCPPPQRAAARCRVLPARPPPRAPQVACLCGRRRENAAIKLELEALRAKRGAEEGEYGEEAMAMRAEGEGADAEKEKEKAPGEDRDKGSPAAKPGCRPESAHKRARKADKAEQPEQGASRLNTGGPCLDTASHAPYRPPPPTPQHTCTPARTTNTLHCLPLPSPCCFFPLLAFFVRRPLRRPRALPPPTRSAMLTPGAK